MKRRLVLGFLVLLGGLFWLVLVAIISSISRSSSDDAPFDSGKEYIEVNPNSSIASDISEIWHDPVHDVVCVHLREGSRCPNPYFIGRLSGKSHTMLDWRSDGNYFNNGTIHCGSYNNAWIPRGAYHVEILIIFCRDFGIAALQRSGNLSGWLGYDFAHDCLEDPSNDRITIRETFIRIQSDVKGVRRLAQGCWGHNINATEKSNTVPLVHTTRYQPQGCLGTNLPQRCKTPMDNSYLESLSFFWRDHEWMKQVSPYQVDSGLDAMELDMSEPITRRRAVETLENETHGGSGLTVDLARRNKEFDGPKICIVGASHSEVLVIAFYLNNLGHRFILASAKFPEDLNQRFFDSYYHKRNCTKFVIGIGQWAASVHAWGRHGGTTFRHWWDGMSNLIGKIKLFMSSIGNDNIKFFMRSIHHNPISDRIGSCQDGRPMDWRSPTVVEGYNAVLQMLVDFSNDSNIEYLDTSFITYPVWDMTLDWCHHTTQVSKVEALYIAFKVLLGSKSDHKREKGSFSIQNYCNAEAYQGPPHIEDSCHDDDDKLASIAKNMNCSAFLGNMSQSSWINGPCNMVMEVDVCGAEKRLKNICRKSCDACTTDKKLWCGSRC